MRAITRSKYGGPEVLKLTEIPGPVCKADEILVKVHATTVNRTDCGILTGKPYIIRAFSGLLGPRNKVPGTDFAGEVIKVGGQVTNYKVGDRVWGLNDDGLSSYAEFMTIKSKAAIAKIPTRFSYEQAAASAEGAHYAYNFINKVKIDKDAKVMLNGATGAIGSAALQMLKARNIYVTAVANTKNMELIASLGPNKLYNYETEDFTNDKEKYEFVFDAVGKSSFSKCKHLLKDQGIYISTELGEGNENVYLSFLTMFGAKKRVVFPMPSKPKISILFMCELIEKGAFTPLIDRTYKMEEIADAYQYVMSGQKTGNVILSIC